VILIKKFKSFFIYVQLINGQIFGLNFQIRLLFIRIQKSLLLYLLSLNKVNYEHQLKNLILMSFDSCFIFIRFSILQIHFALKLFSEAGFVEIAITARFKYHRTTFGIESLFFL